MISEQKQYALEQDGNTNKGRIKGNEGLIDAEQIVH